ncbi:hypothetical protein HK102_002828 [Quaeritorhiza haematococci]|nr:hypothetical protein HK102_002828 [Quaeritorhiza haematococci]
MRGWTFDRCFTECTRVGENDCAWINWEQDSDTVGGCYFKIAPRSPNAFLIYRVGGPTGVSAASPSDSAPTSNSQPTPSENGVAPQPSSQTPQPQGNSISGNSTVSVVAPVGQVISGANNNNRNDANTKNNNSGDSAKSQQNNPNSASKNDSSGTLTARIVIIVAITVGGILLGSICGLFVIYRHRKRSRRRRREGRSRTGGGTVAWRIGGPVSISHWKKSPVPPSSAGRASWSTLDDEVVVVLPRGGNVDVELEPPAPTHPSRSESNGFSRSPTVGSASYLSSLSRNANRSALTDYGPESPISAGFFPSHRNSNF